MTDTGSKSSNLQAIYENARDGGLLVLGAFLQALGLRFFLVPAHLVSGGVSGLAQILNYYTHWPIGILVLIGNIPLFLVGWRYLGGRRFIMRTVVAVVAFSSFTEILFRFAPSRDLTPDVILNTLYGGVISGLGYGMVYRARGTSGGSDILARILYHWRGISISQSYLWVDSLVILAAGAAFGWDRALYALVVLYVSGLAAEWMAEGSKVVRTALIITSYPQDVSEQILLQMRRGVTQLSGRGGYTGADRAVLYCVVSRAEVAQLKALVRTVDSLAFMVIGQAHEALGEGFQQLSV